MANTVCLAIWQSDIPKRCSYLTSVRLLIIVAPHVLLDSVAGQQQLRAQVALVLHAGPHRLAVVNSNMLAERISLLEQLVAGETERILVGVELDMLGQVRLGRTADAALVAIGSCRVIFAAGVRVGHNKHCHVGPMAADVVLITGGLYLTNLTNFFFISPNVILQIS